MVALAVYLPGFFAMPAVDRDEARFAQASRQMLESGDWVVPRIQERLRLNKPPVIYWLQASSAGVLGGWWTGSHGAIARDAIWMYRLPSLVAACIAVLATWRLGNRMFTPPVGLYAGMMLAICPVFAWEARQARADMTLVAITTLALSALWRVAGRAESRPSVLSVLWLWVVVGAGTMVKGPITPMVVGLGLLSLCVLRRGFGPVRAGKPLLGLLVVGAMCVPWLWMVSRSIGWETCWENLRAETLGRTISSKEGHWGPPGYHTVLMPVLFWPGSMLAGQAVVRAWRRRGAAAESFALAVLIPSWIVFEAVSTKLPHYPMPLYPVLAVLSARTLLAGVREWGVVIHTTWTRRLLGAWLLIGVGLWVFASGMVSWMCWSGLGRAAGIGAMAACFAALVLGTRLGFGLLAGRDARGLQRFTLVVGGVSVALIGLSLPRIPDFWLSARVAEELSRLDPSHARPVLTVGSHEDSMIYETRGRARRVNFEALASYLAEHPGALVVLTRDQAAELGATPLADLSGFNYSRGKWLELTITEPGRGR